MRHRIIGNDIIEYINTMHSSVENNVNPKIDDISLLLENTKWTGIGKNHFKDSYDSITFEMKKIPKVIDLYLKFLSIAMNKYENLTVELKKSFDELEEELYEGDVNERLHDS